MDLVALAYYGTICAVLGAVAPALRTLPARLVVGALVGLGAASALPVVRVALGG